MMGFLVCTAGIALCLCPILWLLGLDEYLELAWAVFNIAAPAAFLWPFVKAFLL